MAAESEMGQANEQKGSCCCSEASLKEKLRATETDKAHLADECDRLQDSLRRCTEQSAAERGNFRRHLWSLASKLRAFEDGLKAEQHSIGLALSRKDQEIQVRDKLIQSLQDEVTASRRCVQCLARETQDHAAFTEREELPVDRHPPPPQQHSPGLLSLDLSAATPSSKAARKHAPFAPQHLRTNRPDLSPVVEEAESGFVDVQHIEIVRDRLALVAAVAEEEGTGGCSDDTSDGTQDNGSPITTDDGEAAEIGRLGEHKVAGRGNRHAANTADSSGNINEDDACDAAINDLCNPDRSQSSKMGGDVLGPGSSAQGNGEIHNAVHPIAATTPVTATTETEQCNTLEFLKENSRKCSTHDGGPITMPTVVNGNCAIGRDGNDMLIDDARTSLFSQTDLGQDLSCDDSGQIDKDDSRSDADCVPLCREQARCAAGSGDHASEEHRVAENAVPESIQNDTVPDSDARAVDAHGDEANGIVYSRDVSTTDRSNELERVQHENNSELAGASSPECDSIDNDRKFQSDDISSNWNEGVSNNIGSTVATSCHGGIAIETSMCDVEPSTAPVTCNEDTVDACNAACLTVTCDDSSERPSLAQVSVEFENIDSIPKEGEKGLDDYDVIELEDPSTSNNPQKSSNKQQKSGKKKKNKAKRKSKGKK